MAEVSLAMDSATREERPATLCKALRFLMDRVSLMSTDSANCILRFLAPVIANNGVDYERGKFQYGPASPPSSGRRRGCAT